MKNTVNNLSEYTACLIGAGRIGFLLGFDKKREQPASHTMALLGNKKISLVAACDKNVERLELWQKYVKKHSKKLFTTPSVFTESTELYKNFPKTDIIVVAVNEESHLAECIKAIEQKPRLVILEKPVALNMEQALKIEECAQKNNVCVMVNHERRFDLNYGLALSWCKKIGDIQSVHAELDSGLRIYGEEFEKDGTYSLIHDGTHLVDIVRFLTGEELSCPVVTGVYKDEKGLVRNFSANYSTQKIPEIVIKMSGRSRFFEFRIEILGTLGKICVGNGFTELYLRKESSLYTGFYSLKGENVKVPKRSDYFSGMIKNAVDFLDGREKLFSPLSEAVKDLKVLEEIKAELKKK